MAAQNNKPAKGNVKTSGTAPKIITTDPATKGYSSSQVPRNLSGGKGKK